MTDYYLITTRYSFFVGLLLLLFSYFWFLTYVFLSFCSLYLFLSLCIIIKIFNSIGVVYVIVVISKAMKQINVFTDCSQVIFQLHQIVGRFRFFGFFLFILLCILPLPWKLCTSNFQAKWISTPKDKNKIIIIIIVAYCKAVKSCHE